MSSDPSPVTIEDVGGALRVSGDLDAFSVPALAKELDQRAEGEAGTVSLDLASVTFIDSSALQVLVDLNRRLADRGGSLVLATPSDAVRRLLEVTGLADHFTITE